MKRRSFLKTFLAAIGAAPAVDAVAAIPPIEPAKGMFATITGCTFSGDVTIDGDQHTWATALTGQRRVTVTGRKFTYAGVEIGPYEWAEFDRDEEGRLVLMARGSHTFATPEGLDAEREKVISTI